MTGASQLRPPLRPLHDSRVHARGPGWIGHAGLAGSRPGAGPSRATLSAAAALGLDWLEIDICACYRDELVLRHHSRLPGGRPIHLVALSELRRAEPETVTLTEAVEHLGSAVPLLIDVKSPRVVGPLTTWLEEHGREAEFAVCSESRDALLHFAERLPWVLRWRSLTAICRWTAETIPPPLRPLLRDAFPGAAWAAGGFAGAGADVAWSWTALLGAEHVAERARRMLATLERERLPAHLAELVSDVGTSGIAIDHWAVTPELCERAHALGLSVAAWTVNELEMARGLAREGVDFIISDDVERVRAAYHAVRSRPPDPSGIAIRRRPPGGDGL